MPIRASRAGCVHVPRRRWASGAVGPGAPAATAVARAPVAAAVSSAATSGPSAPASVSQTAPSWASGSRSVSRRCCSAASRWASASAASRCDSSRAGLEPRGLEGETLRLGPLRGDDGRLGESGLEPSGLGLRGLPLGLGALRCQPVRLGALGRLTACLLVGDARRLLVGQSLCLGGLPRDEVCFVLLSLSLVLLPGEPLGFGLLGRQPLGLGLLATLLLEACLLPLGGLARGLGLLGGHGGRARLDDERQVVRRRLAHVIGAGDRLGSCIGWGREVVQPAPEPIAREVLERRAQERLRLRIEGVLGLGGVRARQHRCAAAAEAGRRVPAGRAREPAALEAEVEGAVEGVTRDDERAVIDLRLVGEDAHQPPDLDQVALGGATRLERVARAAALAERLDLARRGHGSTLPSG